MTTQDLIADLRSRINPAYATQPGTESYERRECADALEALQSQLDVQAGSIDAVQSANQRLSAERDQLRAEIERLKAMQTESDWAAAERVDNGGQP